MFGPSPVGRTISGGPLPVLIPFILLSVEEGHPGDPYTVNDSVTLWRHVEVLLTYFPVDWDGTRLLLHRSDLESTKQPPVLFTKSVKKKKKITSI